jgi:hypothetical protein
MNARTAAVASAAPVIELFAAAGRGPAPGVAE